jgi:hypothetical protein
MGALGMLLAAAGASARRSVGVKDGRHRRPGGPAVAHRTVKLAGLPLPAQLHHVSGVEEPDSDENRGCPEYGAGSVGDP